MRTVLPLFHDAATYSNAAKNFPAEVLLNASACQAPKER
jgi:hypothetical protein